MRIREALWMRSDGGGDDADDADDEGEGAGGGCVDVVDDEEADDEDDGCLRNDGAGCGGWGGTGKAWTGMLSSLGVWVGNCLWLCYWGAMRR